MLASAARAGKDLIVAHLLSIGVSADGGYDGFQLKVYSKYIITRHMIIYRVHHYC